MVTPVLRYSAPFLKRVKVELMNFDRRTKNLLTIHNTLYYISNTDFRFLPRKEGGSRLLNTEDKVNTATLDLENYENYHQPAIPKR